jgi:hypothetical protein
MMNKPAGDWGQTIAHLLALADRMEGHGQLNIAKLARAAADALSRRAAYDVNLPHDPDALVSDLGHLLVALPGLGLGNELARAMEHGAAAMAEGRLPLIHEMPNPYVCRTCGELVMGKPETRCGVCGAWPTTFQQFQPIYWLDDLEPWEALVQLRHTPEQVAGLLAGLTEEQLTRPAAGEGWSMRQVVSHLRDAEGVLRFRIQLMTEHDNPGLQSLAVFAWATSEEDRPPATAEIYETYVASRRESLKILEGLPAEDWRRTGQHQEFGEVTILQQASYFSAHEQTHLASLASLRSALSG